MGGRLLEAITGIGVLASAVILVAMLAAPWLTSGTEPVGDAASPGPSASAPTASEGSGPRPPPLGTFALEGPLDFGRICLGIELAAEAYPVAAGVRGAATVYWWESSIVDPGHPEACESRAGDLNAVDAVVERILDEDDPDGAPIGYTLLFHLPGPTGAERDMEVALLTAQSAPDRIQALDLTTTGSGLVFERVTSIDPPFVPLPSAPPPTGQLGQFLLRGPLADTGLCLVIEFGDASYPLDEGAVGTAAVRSWEPGGSDPADPTVCLSRIGDIAETTASVSADRDPADPAAAPMAYTVAFQLTMPAGAGGGSRDVELHVPLEPDPDTLTAFLVDGDGAPLGLDRVDSIDPPLVPAP